MAEFADKDEASRVTDAFEQVKKLMQADISPTDALLQAARSHRLTPAHVETVGHTLNQSIAGAVQLGPDPGEEFDTANIEAVKKAITSAAATPVKKAGQPADINAAVGAAAANDYSAPAGMRKVSSFEKAAADTAAALEPLTPFTRDDATRLSADMQHVRSTCAAAALSATNSAISAVDKYAALYMLAPDSQREQSVYAMLSLSGPASVPVLAHLQSKHGVDAISELDKNASLPAECSNLAVAGVLVLDKVAAMLEAQATLDNLDAECAAVAADMQKVAEGGNLFTNALLLSGMSGEQTKPEYEAKSAEEIMSPEATTRLRALKNEQKFYSMMLNDPDVGKYRPDDVLKARNSVVEMNPSAAVKPYLLRSMVLDRLARGGLSDPMSLANEQKMHLTDLEGKNFRYETALNAAKLKEIKSRNATKIVNPLTSIGDAVSGGLNASTSALKTGLDTLAGGAKKGLSLIGTTGKAVAGGEGGGEKPGSAVTKIKEKDLADILANIDQFHNELVNNPATAMSPAALNEFKVRGMDPDDMQERLRNNPAGVIKLMADIRGKPGAVMDLVNKANKTRDEKIALSIAGKQTNGDSWAFLPL